MPWPCLWHAVTNPWSSGGGPHKATWNSPKPCTGERTNVANGWDSYDIVWLFNVAMLGWRLQPEKDVTKASSNLAMKTHLHFYVSKWPLVPTYLVYDSKSQTPIPNFFLFLNGLYVSSPTSLVYDSKTQTPISIFISLNGLSFFCCQLASTSHLDKPCLRPPRAGPGGNRYPTVTELRHDTSPSKRTHLPT